MSTFLDVCLSIGETATISGSIVFSESGLSTINVSIEKYTNNIWTTYHSFSEQTLEVTDGDEVQYDNYGSFSLTMTETGVYRWVIIAEIGISSSTTHTYFEVESTEDLLQPTLLITNLNDGIHAEIQIVNSNEDAYNDIYIHKVGEEFSDSYDIQIYGNGTSEISLSTGRYYAKVISHNNQGSVSGKNDPIEFWITKTTQTTSQTKNIDNVKLEEITNTFFGNQFMGYFTKLPQIGYYQTDSTKSLNLKYLDKLNETMRGITLPQTSIPMIPINYFGHQNAYYNGVGDGNLGSISIRFKLDRYMNNYSALLQWAFLKYDWTYGGKNPNNNILNQEDVEGMLIVEFLDAEEQITRKIGYKIIIDNHPSISLGVDTPDEMEFETTFIISDIDPSKFVIGQPLSDVQRIL